MILFTIMFAWILGILGGLYLEISTVLFVLIPIVLIACVNNKFIKRYLKLIEYKKIIIIFLIVLTISYVNIKRLENSFNNKYEGVNDEINLVGTIISDRVEKDYKYVYTIKIESINGENKYKNTNLLLHIKKEKNVDCTIKYGDKVHIKGNFQEPNIQRNYKGFDYKEYLKAKKIYGIVDTTMLNIKNIKSDNVNPVYLFANNISNSIDRKISNILDKEEAALLSGMLIGNKDNIGGDVLENFRDSNLSHMLAISGAHISYIILGLTTLMVRIKVSKGKMKVLTIIFLIFFMIMTKASPSVVRACIMAIYAITLSLFHKRDNIWASISLSMMIILIYNPYYIFDIGLQLSYGGTIGIVLINNIMRLYRKEEKGKKNAIKKLLLKIKEISITTLGANIVIIPIMILHFNTISFTFLISNLLASSIFGVIIILGFVAVFISFISEIIAIPFTFILSISLKLLIQISEICSELPLSKIYLKTPYIFSILIYYTILFTSYTLLKIKKKENKRRIEKRLSKTISRNYKKALAILLSIVLIIQLLKILPQDLKIYLVDVGQGDCTLITTPTGKNILIDGGGNRDRSSFDVGEKTLLPYLLDRRISTIDYCMVSHFDSDHVGGLFYVLENIKVKYVIICTQGEDSENYQYFKEVVKEKRIKVIVVKKDDIIKFDKYTYIEVLWPKQEQIRENVLNNNSIVCKFYYNNISILFTGDIEKIAEREIMKEYANTNKLNSTILKVAHHGSKSSTIDEMVDKIKPKIALIGVGEANTFRPPEPRRSGKIGGNTVVKYFEQTCVVKFELKSIKKVGYG